MKKIIKEAIAKNAIIILILILSYPLIQDHLINSNLPQDEASTGDILVAVSIIAVIACFGCFAFTYEKIDQKSAIQRSIAHITTGILMLIIGINMIFTSILITFIVGNFFLIDMILALLYVACVGYDFWDVMRLK